MTNRAIAALQVVVAGAAVVGCVLSWLAARSAVAVGPVIAGEPGKTSLVYYPPLLAQSLLLAAVAGVALVSAWARLRR